MDNRTKEEPEILGQALTDHTADIKTEQREQEITEAFDSKFKEQGK